MAIPNKNIGAFREMLFSITLLAFYTRPVVFTYEIKVLLCFFIVKETGNKAVERFKYKFDFTVYQGHDRFIAL